MALPPWERFPSGMIKDFASGALDTEESGGSGFWPLAFLSSVVLFGFTPPQSLTVSLCPADEADDLSPRSQRGQLCQCSCHQPPQYRSHFRALCLLHHSAPPHHTPIIMRHRSKYLLFFFFHSLRCTFSFSKDVTFLAQYCKFTVTSEAWC